MSGQADLWAQHIITAIGLSMPVYRAWPLLGIAESSGFYQPVDDTTGIVFLRYGSGESLDTYLGKLGGMFTTVAVRSDAAVSVSGLKARRVSAHMTTPARGMYRDEPGRGITHQELPAEHTALTVLGFSHRATPILAGYRMPESSLGHYRDRLEYMLNSIAAVSAPDLALHSD